jgi:hypothetical protein
MAITCDPSQLANASVCFANCIPPGQQAAVQTYLLAYLLNQLTGTTSMDPKVLLAAATAQGSSFLVCEGVQQEVQAYLLCQLATASGA